MPVNGWDADGVRAAAMDEVERRLTAAAIAVQNRARKLISVAGTGQARGDKGRFIRVYGANPSAPGDPPHKQTGRLRASVTYDVAREGRRIVARVGTNLKYGFFLEVGTRRMKARPWLRRALAESAKDIRRIMGT